MRSQAEVRFSERVPAESLRTRIGLAATALGIEPPEVELTRKTPDGGSGVTWQVKSSADPAQTQNILAKLQEDLQGTPYLLSSSTIGVP